MNKRKVAIFTGNRAEYGLQLPILRAVYADARLKPYLLVGGAHLQEDFGNTITEIKKDGFSVYRQVEMKMDKDDLYATAQAIGTGVLSVSNILEELRPDWLVVYADRFESFAAAIAGTQMGIPTAHIEGGDYTGGGALDDSVRHAMSKLAHLHFVTNEEAHKRVVKMGEADWRVFNVGQPALDLAAAGEFAAINEIVEWLNINPKKPIVLFCQHSVSTEYDQAVSQVRPSINALKRLANEGYQIIITYPNNDAGGLRIIDELHKNSLDTLPNVQIHKNLGRYNMHGISNIIGRSGSGAFAGNSSALIKETPFFGCPAVNIGSRQWGRLRGNNVIDVDYNEQAIYNAIKQCVEDEEFRKQCKNCFNPYGAGDAGPRIAEILAIHAIDSRLIRKKMSY